MLIPFTHDEIELALGKFRIDQREWNAMKGKVPRCIPWKFPLIWHRHDALVVKMTPLRVASVLTFLRRRRESGIAFEPLIHDVVIKLFGPKHSRKRLAFDRAVLRAQALGRKRGVKFIGFMRARFEQLIEVLKCPEGFFTLRDLLQP